MARKAFAWALGSAMALALVSMSGQAVVLALDEPASFTGTLPCADCPGVAWHLDLWPDGRFHLRQRYLDRGDEPAHDDENQLAQAPGARDQLGRWRRNPADDSLLLQGGREAPLRLQVVDLDTLRLMDTQGRSIESDLSYELRREEQFSPTEIALSLYGEFRYFADSASFEECLTGYRYPVLMEGDYRSAESAYGKELRRSGADPGSALYLRLDGSVLNRRIMEHEGPTQSLYIDRFVGFVPSLRCERAMSTATLANTYWRLRKLDQKVVSTSLTATEVHMILHDAHRRVAGSTGCNRFTGGYEIDGDQLSFSPLAGTMMACEEPAMELEQRVHQALAATRRWRIIGQTLELFADDDEPLMFFEAVYLP